MKRKAILVSVICAAYNHEKFISETLESLIKQKTNFKYEVLVHDDCSTDKTARIIKDYEKKYPEIIKAYYEEENQYSKKVSNFLMMAKEAKGKYLAICEGDDFWLNENKLQKQVNYIENNQGCTMCISASLLVNVNSEKVGEMHPFIYKGDYRIPDYLNRKSNIPTASILTRTEDLIAVYSSPYKKVSDVADVPIGLYMFSNGYVHYEDCCDVAYRINNPNSWVGRTRGEKYVKHLKNSIEVHKVFDEYTKGKYADDIAKKVREKEADILICEKRFISVLREYKDVLRRMSTKKKIYVFLGAYVPFLLKLRRKLGRK